MLSAKWTPNGWQTHWQCVRKRCIFAAYTLLWVLIMLEGPNRPMHLTGIFADSAIELVRAARQGNQASQTIVHAIVSPGWLDKDQMCDPLMWRPHPSTVQVEAQVQTLVRCSGQT